MKKLIIILIAAFGPVFLIAQDTPLSALYDRYVSETGFETTEILPGSMSFEPGVSSEFPKLGEMLKNIEKIRILKYDAEEGDADMDKIWKKIQKAAANDEYKEVVNINAKNEQVRILMMKSASGNTREVGMIAKSEKGIMLLTVTGDMNFSEMFSPENMKGLCEMAEHFMHEKSGCSHPKD